MAIEHARAAMIGLSVGDAFGTMLDGYGAEFARRAAKRLIAMKRPWRWTDDTAMALSIVDELVRDPGRARARGRARVWLRRRRGGRRARHRLERHVARYRAVLR